MTQQKWFDLWFDAERAAVQAIRKAQRDSTAAVQRERALRAKAVEQPARRRPATGASRTGAAS